MCWKSMVRLIDDQQKTWYKCCHIFCFNIIETPTKEPAKAIKELPVIENGKSKWTQLLLHA